MTFASASEITSVPRCWRMYLALWLIRRWRLPTAPCLILPVAVSLKRFFTPLFVLSLGIFVSFVARHVQPALAALDSQAGGLNPCREAGAHSGERLAWQARAG